MNWKPLYEMQTQLDQHIENTHALAKGGKVDEKILALLVELGELANETRCFKFWSTKPASEKEVILEEYVDGVHFLLSIGLDMDLDYESGRLKEVESQTSAFLSVYKSIEEFRMNKDLSTYRSAFRAYLELGLTLGIKEGELIHAYERKNEINFQRQDDGY